MDKGKERFAHKGLGIAALTIAVFGMGIPGITIYLVWLALILAALSAFLGNKVFPPGCHVVCLINAFFLAPPIWILFMVEPRLVLKAITIVLFIAPIAGLIIGRRKKLEIKTS
jgi:hypothetical protein